MCDNEEEDLEALELNDFWLSEYDIKTPWEKRFLGLMEDPLRRGKKNGKRRR